MRKSLAYTSVLLRILLSIMDVGFELIMIRKIFHYLVTSLPNSYGLSDAGMSDPGLPDARLSDAGQALPRIVVLAAHAPMAKRPGQLPALVSLDCSFHDLFLILLVVSECLTDPYLLSSPTLF